MVIERLENGLNFRRKELAIQTTVRSVANIAVDVFALIAGLRMLSVSEGIARALAFAIILIGIVALEANVIAILKRR